MGNCSAQNDKYSNATYDGNWKDGRKDGYGKMTYDFGNRYEGEWKDDHKNGQGTYYFANGDRYEGEWKDGNMNCKGTFYWANGNRYEGEWKDDHKNGQGTYYFANGDRYEGEWKDDHKNQGTFYWANGDIYEDKLVVDLKNVHVYLIGSCGSYDLKIFASRKIDRSVERQLASVGYASLDAQENERYLGGVNKDLTNLEEFFLGKVKYWSYLMDPEMSVDVLKNKIRIFFTRGNDDRDVYLLLYSGHGTQPTEPNKGGDWACNDGKVTLEDVLQIWQDSDAYKRSKSTFLFLVCDSCFSGCWVNRLRQSQARRVVIQAASSPTEPAKDTKFGGAFMCYWLKKLKDPKIKIELSQTPMLGSRYGREGEFVISPRIFLFE